LDILTSLYNDELHERQSVITPAEEAYVLNRAYVPEHIVSMMILISKGEPFLAEDYLGLVKDNWLIFVGYPLDGIFSRERCERIVLRAVETHQPEYLWFIGPELPSFLLDACNERERDQYYKLDIEKTEPKPSLKRVTAKALQELTVGRGREFLKEHEALITELLERKKLPDRVRELYRAMPDYIGRSSSAWVLDARDKRGNLCAFSVVELGAENFSAYILGGHSKRHYAPHASDLLFLEMIMLTREQGKSGINLGLGVNEGIQRFKRKWGGKPFLKYEFCERRYGVARKVSLIDALMGEFSGTKNFVSSQ
jgi:hypothetical protein